MTTTPIAAGPNDVTVRPAAWMHDQPDRFDVIHAEAKALWLKAWPKQVEHYTIPLYRHQERQPLSKIAEEIFQAGAASRDVEIAELVGVLGNVTAHLIAAHSLLSSGGKKAVASDTIFKIMLQDYEKSFEAGRKALAKVRKP